MFPRFSHSVKLATFGLGILMPLAWLQAQIRPPFREDRILVQPAVANIDDLHRRLGTRILRSYPEIGGIQVVQLPPGLAVPQAIFEFQTSGLVQYAEPDYLVQATETNPNDPAVPDGLLGGLGRMPLYLFVVPERQNLQFYWSSVGTNYFYTLEGKESLTSTNWFALPGASWPLTTNHCTLAAAQAPARFYRVKAVDEISFRTLDQGTYSCLTPATNLVIRRPADWETLWQRYQGMMEPPAPVPAVDFEKEMVVAVMMGLKPTGGYAIRIERIEPTHDTLKIFIAQQTPGPDSIVTQCFTAPFHFVAVAKSELEPEFDIGASK